MSHVAPPPAVPETRYRRLRVDGIDLFYREAGPTDGPTIVLLHGFPSSSRMYQPLIPHLATRYHVIAPDYPGFGHSDAAAPEGHGWRFDGLAQAIRALISALGIDRYSLFMQDYGGPVGFRLALADPARITTMIVQNANAYAEGLGPKWAGIARFWDDRAAHPEVAAGFLSAEAAKARHIGDSPNPDRYDPDSWTDEAAFLARPGQHHIQSELLYDYRTNIAAYPAWQGWLRTHRPPLLVLWGRHDPSFIVPGALAYARDVPDAEIHILDAGHFALDEQPGAVAQLTLDFLDRRTRP